MVIEAECSLHFLRLAEAMLAFHSTRAQVETSNPIPYKSDENNEFYALEVIKVYLCECNFD